MRSSSTSTFELAGAADGEFDTLVATGQVALDGMLEVVLSDVLGDLFSPAPGDTFSLIVGAELIGDFASTSLPDLSGGLSWNLLQDATSLVLEVLGAPSDFNQNGVIDGGDFLTWQRDPSVGDLSGWQNDYGANEPLATASTTVPEPTTFVFLSTMLPALCTRRRRWN